MFVQNQGSVLLCYAVHFTTKLDTGNFLLTVSVDVAIDGGCMVDRYGCFGTAAQYKNSILIKVTLKENESKYNEMLMILLPFIVYQSTQNHVIPRSRSYDGGTVPSPHTENHIEMLQN